MANALVLEANALVLEVVADMDGGARRSASEGRSGVSRTRAQRPPGHRGAKPSEARNECANGA
jgi:hypothetical protein